jgi:excisionase family DNA binding protein
MTGVEGRSQGKRRVTAREAATLLGVHYNTVRNRIKDGTIQAEKVVTEHGPTWMIDPDSLTTNAPTSADQRLVGRVPEEALTILAREIVREAGVAQDPARTALLENDKARAEMFRTMAILDTALLAGLGAVAAIVPDVQMVWALRASVTLMLVSITLALFGLINATIVIGKDAERSDWMMGLTSRAWREWAAVGTVAMFGVGLLLFILFAGSNLARWG